MADCTILGTKKSKDLSVSYLDAQKVVNNELGGMPNGSESCCPTVHHTQLYLPCSVGCDDSALGPVTQSFVYLREKEVAGAHQEPPMPFILPKGTILVNFQIRRTCVPHIYDDVSDFKHISFALGFMDSRVLDVYDPRHTLTSEQASELAQYIVPAIYPVRGDFLVALNSILFDIAVSKHLRVYPGCGPNVRFPTTWDLVHFCYPNWEMDYPIDTIPEFSNALCLWNAKCGIPMPWFPVITVLNTDGRLQCDDLCFCISYIPGESCLNPLNYGSTCGSSILYEYDNLQ